MKLEWTWIDNYDGSLAAQLTASQVNLTERDFELNHTRIITNQQYYRIPLAYSQGFLVYRVRGIGRWTNNSGANIKHRKNGAWSTDGSTILNAISDWPHYIEIGEEHEGNMNWQFQAVYAEDGKKKEIISYFDGTLRNRQTVTRINSNNEAIVGESVYDNQGRAAISILPTPVDYPGIQYYPDLNRNMSENPFNHTNFDWDDIAADTCNLSPEQMSTSNGASKYLFFQQYTRKQLAGLRSNSWRFSIYPNGLYA